MGERATRTLDAAIDVIRTEAIQVAKWSARANPAATAMPRSRRGRARHSARAPPARKIGSRTRLAKVRRQAAIAIGGAEASRMSGAAHAVARIARMRTPIVRRWTGTNAILAP